MSIEAILRKAGLVPIVPIAAHQAGTARTLVASNVPVVPTVPSEKSGDGSQAVKSSLSSAATRTDIRPDLLALADGLAVDCAHIRRLDDDGMTLLAAIGPQGWRAFLLAADDAAARQAGKVPLDDTAAILCYGCGPVYVHPSIAEVLPVVDGWPRALGCPWCAIRKAGGYIPRPPAQYMEAAV